MTNPQTVTDFLEALQEQSSHNGGLEYAIGFLQGTLSELNLSGHEEEILKRSTRHLQGLIRLEKDWENRQRREQNHP
jgi:hypothetical protein